VPIEENMPVRGRLAHNVLSGARLCWDAAPAALIGVSVLAVAVSAVPTAEVWLAKRMVDGVVAARSEPAGAAGLGVTVAALGLVAALRRAFGAIQDGRQELFSERVKNETETRLLAKSAAVELARFDSPEWHDRMARAGRDASWRSAQLAYTGVGLAGNVLALAGLVGLLLSISPILVALALLSVAPALVFERRALRRLYQFWFVTTPADREKGYMRTLLTDDRWAKEVRAFGLAGNLLARFRRLADQQLRTMAGLHNRALVSALLSTVLSAAALAGAYAFMASRGAVGHLTPGDVTAGLGAVAAIASQVNLIASSLLMLDQHASFLDDYFSFLELPPLMPVPVRPRATPSSGAPRLELREVTFRYPAAAEPALRGFDLEVQPGELVALVGENGAGKTSIVKLLLRLYDPERGFVLFDGMDVRELDVAGLRSRIGVLFQDFGQYQLTARDNLLMGRVERPAGEAGLRAALEGARAAGLVDGLPRGLDSNVGRLFEGARDLSTGEWQRLALARLIYRDAALWILDEPTAAMDAAAEAEIFAELRQQLRGRTGIVISHRFSTVRAADRIAVISGGRVSELGSHQELLALGGRYAGCSSSRRPVTARSLGGR
jgi:ABC-type multidrug transport system fused ATPase/permease subunit